MKTITILSVAIRRMKARSKRSARFRLLLTFMMSWSMFLSCSVCPLSFCAVSAPSCFDSSICFFIRSTAAFDLSWILAPSWMISPAAMSLMSRDAPSPAEPSVLAHCRSPCSFWSVAWCAFALASYVAASSRGSSRISTLKACSTCRALCMRPCSSFTRSALACGLSLRSPSMPFSISPISSVRSSS